MSQAIGADVGADVGMMQSEHVKLHCPW